MKIVRVWATLLAASAVLSCHTDIQPIVLDFSATKTPNPAAVAPTPSATPAPTAAPPTPTAPSTSVPTPAATPVPARVPPAPANSAAPPPEIHGQAMAMNRTPERVIQDRIEAYNSGDLDGLVRLFAPDAQVFEPPDRLRDSGLDQIRQSYARRLASGSSSRLSSSGRLVEGNFVAERETESDAAGASRSAIVISEVRDGKIVRIWILR